MSLLELLVVMHVGSTAGLLAVLGVVMTLQRAGATLVMARRASRARALESEQQVSLGLDPRVADQRLIREPGVAGNACRSS